MTTKICSLDLLKIKKVLVDNIEQLNVAIEEASNGVTDNSDEIETIT